MVYEDGGAGTVSRPSAAAADRPAPDAQGPSERDWMLLFTAWLVAFVSALGSLFFSEVMEFAPCVLCWYQRICMFPLVFILARGLFPLDLNVVKYALPLAVAGWLLAVYHGLIYAGWVPADLQPCTKGVSCSEEYIQLFGFLSIPLLSLMAFTVMATILIVLKKGKPA